MKERHGQTVEACSTTRIKLRHYIISSLEQDSTAHLKEASKNQVRTAGKDIRDEGERYALPGTGYARDTEENSTLSDSMGSVRGREARSLVQMDLEECERIERWRAGRRRACRKLDTFFSGLRRVRFPKTMSVQNKQRIQRPASAR
jgi:hypothetical protein